MPRIINLPNNHVAVTDLPEDATYFAINNVAGTAKLVFNSDTQDPLGAGGDMVRIGEGEYQVVGKGDKLTEEQWKRVVETVDYDVPPSPGNDFAGDWRTAYRDYNSTAETGCSEYPFVKTSTESGKTLLSSLSLKPSATLIIKKVK